MPRLTKALIATFAEVSEACSAHSAFARDYVVPALREDGRAHLADQEAKHVENVSAAVQRHNAVLARITKH